MTFTAHPLEEAHKVRVTLESVKMDNNLLNAARNSGELIIRMPLVVTGRLGDVIASRPLSAAVDALSKVTLTAAMAAFMIKPRLSVR